MIDAHTSAAHHADHLFPIWRALDEGERGEFIVTPNVVAHAAKAGVRVRVCHPNTRSRDPVLLASWNDVKVCGRRPFVMVEHGSGQAYGPQPAADTTPDFKHSCRLVLLLAPNEAVAHRTRLHHPHARVEVVGSARVEVLAVARLRSLIGTYPPGSSRESANISDGAVTVGSPSRVVAEVRQRSSGSRPPVAAFAWHWASPLHPCARTAFPHWQQAVTELAAMTDDARGFTMLGHGHPRMESLLRKFYARVGIRWATAAEVIEQADVLGFDSTSFGFECAAVGIPVVLLDAPWFDTGGEEYGLRFWECADAGLRIGSGSTADLHAAITRTLIADPCKERSAEVVAQTYPIVGGATEASVAAIRSLLSSPT